MTIRLVGAVKTYDASQLIVMPARAGHTPSQGRGDQRPTRLAVVNDESHAHKMTDSARRLLPISKLDEDRTEPSNRRTHRAKSLDCSVPVYTTASNGKIW